jgi:hypothetical protein
MENLSPEQWAAEERRRSEELNRQHEARLTELRATDDDLTVQQRAERDAHLVVSSDQLIRRAEGREDPPEGHDITDPQWRRGPVFEPQGPEPVDREALKAEIKAEIKAELRGETEAEGRLRRDIESGN